MRAFFDVLKLYSNDPTANGIKMLDHAIKNTTRFKNLRDAVDNFVKDMANVTENFGARQSLYQNCGIVIGEDYDFTADTGSVVGYNAGGKKILDAQSIVPENKNLSNFDVPKAGSTTFHTYTGADGKKFSFTITYPESFSLLRDNFTISFDKSGNTIADKAKYIYIEPEKTYSCPEYKDDIINTATGAEILAGIHTIAKAIENFWAEECFKLAYDAFGLDFDGKNLNIIFSLNSVAQAITDPSVKDPAHKKTVPANDIDVDINAVIFSKIDFDDPNGNTRIEGGANQNYLDRTFAHEMIHAVMMTSCTLRGTMPEFFTEGVAELIHGLDDFDSNYNDRVLKLAEDNELLEKSMNFKPGSGSMYSYPAGFAFLRYICKQSFAENYYLSEITDPKTEIVVYNVEGDSGKEISPTESDHQQIIVLNEGNQTLTLENSENCVAVVGETSFGKKNIIFGGGNDLGIFTSPDSEVNVTISGGNDSIIVDNGSEVAIDMSESDSDAEIVVRNGKIALNGYNIAKNSEILLPDAENAASAEFSDGKLKFNDAMIDLGDTNFVKVVTGDKHKQIFGIGDENGALDGDSIAKKQILFSNGDSTVRGGSKNDKIYAKDGDTINLSGGEDKIYLNGSDITFELGTGEIKSRTEIVEGFDVENDVVIVNDAENLTVKLINDKLQVRKNNSVLIFDEINDFSAATGLQIQTDDEIYTLRGDYSGGPAKNDNFFWQDSENNYFKPGTTFYVHDDGENREFFIESGCGKATIENFEFGIDGDTLNVTNAKIIDDWNDDLFIRTGDDDYIFVKGGAGEIVNLIVDGTKWSAADYQTGAF